MIAGTFKTSPSTAYFSNRPTLERKAPMLTELQGWLQNASAIIQHDLNI